MPKPIDLIRQGGRVQRYHGKPLQLPETVAEHSFYVAWAIWLYCRAEGTEPSYKVLMGALQHDLAEAVTGDMPGPTKRAIGGDAFAAYEAKVLEDFDVPDFASDLDARDTELLKFGDNLSGYMKSLQEFQMGNRYIERTLRNYRKYLQAQITQVQHLNPDLMKELMVDCEGETDVHY